MTPKEHLINQLRALCNAHGGPEIVADAAEVSAENLKQILGGHKLPSGEPRGVGPTLQKKLEAAYPGWAAQMPLPMSIEDDAVLKEDERRLLVAYRALPDTDQRQLIEGAEQRAAELMKWAAGLAGGAGQVSQPVPSGKRRAA